MGHRFLREKSVKLKRRIWIKNLLTLSSFFIKAVSIVRKASSACDVPEV